MPPQEPNGIAMANKAITDAKRALNATGPNGSSSIATKSGHSPIVKMKPAPAPAPAPKAKAPSTGLIGDQGTDSANGIKANADNVKEYIKNVPKMHKGGVVQEDGLKNLKKGEVVIPEEKAEEGKKIMALKDKAGKGIMAQAKEEEDNEPKKEEKHESKKAEKKEPKKDEKKDSKKSVKKVKGMHVRKVHGGFHVKHDTEPAEAGSNVGPQQSEEHVMPDMGALQDHMSQYMGDEGAEEPSAAAPAEQAAPAQV